MTISTDAILAMTDEIEELQARSETLYDALTHAYAVAKKGRLPNADQEEALARVMEIAKKAKDACDDMLSAAHRKGFELYDQETMDWLAAAGSFHQLTAEGKVRYVGARKRASARASKSLRQHGTDALRLNHTYAPLQLHSHTDD